MKGLRTSPEGSEQVVCTVFVSLYDVSMLKCDCNVSVVIIASCVYVSVNLW